ncbi:MAG: tetratricopeptide repeat protein [Spirochaetales bacterium]
MMDFEKALKAFEEALAFDPTDGPTQVYIERCKFYLQNPPPEDWDGVFVMKTK